MTDNTLLSQLPNELNGAINGYSHFLKNVATRQQAEITYLRQHHPTLIEKPEYAEALQGGSLDSLDTREKMLDEINTLIIKARISVNRTFLDLNSAHITRLPVTLFQMQGYVEFWQNLTELNCSNNYITELNLQPLAALKSLSCSSNQLTALNLQGLTALLVLYCYSNQLTALNVQGLTALRVLACDNNPLTDLNLMDVNDCIKNKYAKLERSLLFKQLNQADSDEDRQVLIARLGYIDSLQYGISNAANLFISDPVNSAFNVGSAILSRVSAFLPSFGMSNTHPEEPNLKRQRDENEMTLDDSEEDAGHEPEFKRMHKG